ncbi:MAG: class I SAM-dependent methyltransferase [Bacteroidia bacterium]|nr:class I SAM-dependent methyltransferase [Bacteroidia bacterium]
MKYLLATPKEWKNYELLDSGNFQKLERFGKVILQRPEPQAVWAPKLPIEEWIKDFEFVQEKSHQGKWLSFSQKPTRWELVYQSSKLKLSFHLSLTNFKHVGIFPEQAVNWEYIYEACKDLYQPKVLNLFAYTGAASLAAAKGGGEVYHLDSIKQVINWANENAILNGLKNLHWVVEDAMLFVKREVKRKKNYEGILLDPPSFGNGPKGEKWKLEEKIHELMLYVAQLLNPKKGFLVLNCYSIGFSAIILESILKTCFQPYQLQNLEIGELLLLEKARNIFLPAGVFARFRYGF